MAVVRAKGMSALLGGAAWRLVLAFILFLTFFPFLFMVMTSLKDTYQFYHTFWAPAWPLHFGNYPHAFSDMGMYIFNSLAVTAMSVGGIVLFSVTAGFLFARYEFPGREAIYYGMLSMMMIPGVLMLVPAAMWVKQLGLMDSYRVMVLPYVAGGQVIAVYLLGQFFSEIDRGLFEAAEVDGAGVVRQMWHVGIPLAKPIIGVVAIISALSVWNQFMWPLVTTRSEDVMVLTVGMLRYTGRVQGMYGQMFAGYVISAVPLGVLFLFTTRTFMRGITSGALKA